MAQLGRRPYIDRPRARKVYIPESVNSQVELLLLDPVRGVPRKGDYSHLVTQLLREWLERQKSQAGTSST